MIRVVKEYAIETNEGYLSHSAPTFGGVSRSFCADITKATTFPSQDVAEVYASNLRGEYKWIKIVKILPMKVTYEY